MNVIACISDGGGMLFAKRRVSRDAAVIADVVETVGDGVLFVSDYSAPLFEQTPLSVVCASEPLSSAEKGDFVFLESAGIAAHKDEIESLTLYKWNRKYPFDTKLDFDPEKDGFRLSEVVEFSGAAHEKITRECWTK